MLFSGSGGGGSGGGSSHSGGGSSSGSSGSSSSSSSNSSSSSSSSNLEQILARANPDVSTPNQGTVNLRSKPIVIVIMSTGGSWLHIST